MDAKRPVLTGALTLLLLGGCATAPSPSQGGQSEGGTTGTSATQSAANRAAQALLGRYGLAGRSTVEVVDALDRMPVAQRPSDLRASVRPGALEVSGPDTTVSMPIPADRFYLSIAPYVDSTHECFYHSLTTCKGELGGKEAHVLIKDDGGRVLVDEKGTTFGNGFVGFWLPRDIDATVAVTVGDRTATARIGTGEDDPTCLTTLKLT